MRFERKTHEVGDRHTTVTQGSDIDPGMTSIRSAKHSVQSKQTSHAAKGKRASALKKKSPAKAHHTPAHQKSSFSGTHHTNGSNGAKHTAPANFDAPHIPHSWHKFAPADAVKELKKIEDNGDSLTLELGKDQSVSLDSTDYASLFKSGALTLYKNPKEEQSDPDDETGRQFWMAGFHVAINRNGPLATVATPIEQLSASGAAISKRLTKELETVSFTVKNGYNEKAGTPGSLKAKAEARAALPKGKAVFDELDAAHAKWEAKTKAIESQPMSADERKFVTDALKQTEPKLDGASMTRDNFTNLEKADKAIFSKPDVLAVDAFMDGELRITVDTMSVVAKGGTMGDYVKDLKKTLKDAGVTSKLEIDRNVNMSQVQDMVVKQIIEPALGQGTMAQYGSGNDSISFGFHAADWDRAKPLEATAQAFVNKYNDPDRPTKVEFEKVSY